MSTKPCLIVFYSRTGVTRTAAQRLAEAVPADLEEIHEEKDRAGILGWIGAGRDATLKRRTKILPPEKNPADYAVVAIGTPVWAFTLAPPARAYLDQMKLRLPKVAFFCTMGSSGADRTFRVMTELAAREPLATMALVEKAVRAGACEAEIEAFAAALRTGSKQ